MLSAAADFGESDGCSATAKPAAPAADHAKAAAGHNSQPCEQGRHSNRDPRVRVHCHAGSKIALTKTKTRSSLGAEPLSALVFYGLNGPLKHEADLRQMAERWIREGNLLPSAEHANQVIERLRAMESGAIVGRGADFSNLQSIRERVFAPGRRGFRDRMQHSTEEEARAAAPAAPAASSATAGARARCTAAATVRQQRRREAEVADAQRAAGGAGAGAAGAGAGAGARTGGGSL